MNIDFHYYGTYTAARLAGYDFKSAQTIAYAAQYVDDSSMDMLKNDKGNYYITDFIPVPTVQSNMELGTNTSAYNGSPQNVEQAARTWASFHFLPSNYGANPGTKSYSGVMSNEGTIDCWSFDKESQEQFKLLCLPNNQLVKEMINDVTKNYRGTSYEIYMTGLRMHVLADTWAHMYYAGIPAWFMNDALNDVYDITRGKTISWVWVWPEIDRFNLENCTPTMPAYNSYVYLGHGRMGHLPDYPWIKYRYTPLWSSRPIIKDNPTEFMLAFKQMVKALRCIREGVPFNVGVYENISQQNEAVINSILNTQVNNQSDIWRSNISKIRINNIPIEAPEIYDVNKWLNAMKTAADKRQTDYYKFNYSAVNHLNLIKGSLAKSNIFLDEIPEQNILRINLKSNVSSYVGAVENWEYYYPAMSSNCVELNIIKPNGDPLKSGDVVRIRTSETRVGNYNYLGAWKTTALYYYNKEYSTGNQKWKIESLNGGIGTEIKDGDIVKIKNMLYKNKPFMDYYNWIGYGTYLTTINDSKKGSTNWQLQFMPACNKYVNIVCKNSAKVFDVYNGSKDNEANIIEYHNTGGDNQKFQFIDCKDGYYNIVCKNSGKYIDVYGGGKDNNARIIQFQGTGGDNQKFKFIYCGGGYYNIMAKHSGKLLDVSGGSADDGTQIIQFQSTGGDNQKFKFV